MQFKRNARLKFYLSSIFIGKKKENMNKKENRKKKEQRKRKEKKMKVNI